MTIYPVQAKGWGTAQEILARIRDKCSQENFNVPEKPIQCDDDIVTIYDFMRAPGRDYAKPNKRQAKFFNDHANDIDLDFIERFTGSRREHKMRINCLSDANVELVRQKFGKIADKIIPDARLSKIPDAELLAKIAYHSDPNGPQFGYEFFHWYYKPSDKLQQAMSLLSYMNFDRIASKNIVLAIAGRTPSKLSQARFKFMADNWDLFHLTRDFYQMESADHKLWADISNYVEKWNQFINLY
jgi:hypothetical protein